MKLLILTLFTLLLGPLAQAQQRIETPDLRELERKLDAALQQTAQLTAIIESLRADIAQLKAAGGESGTPPTTPGSAQPPVPSEREEAIRAAYRSRIIGPGLGSSERNETLTARPELFVQGRYSAAPIAGSDEAFRPNFRLSRIESRWSGRVANRLGVGLEIQYHPAPDGSPEELVNDAFIEYYANDYVTLRAGQFIKPFGFDIQQSSSVRESPERGIFAGYFFPGQRDRGLLLFGNLGFLGGEPLKRTQYFVGVVNGNRFFNDSNRQANYLFRIRHVNERAGIAVGASVQLGKQLLPPGVAGNNDERLYGLDLQYVSGRLGLRAEIVTGNMPSTLLGLEPDFSPAFRPGAHSTGGAVLVNYRVAGSHNVYARYDQFNGDPVTGRNVRAVNFGYFRNIGGLSRLAFDYQWKNRPSLNDDAINGRFQVTWNLLLGRDVEYSATGDKK